MYLNLFMIKRPIGLDNGIFLDGWYNQLMIITKLRPFSLEEIVKLKEAFASYIKTVIDLDQKICSSGCQRHFDCEQILLKQGSEQKNIWGGGIDLMTKTIDFNSLINIRPFQNNNSNEIINEKLRDEFEKLMKYFFKNIYGDD